MTPNTDTQVSAEAAELRRQARTLRSVADGLEARAARIEADALDSRAARLVAPPAPPASALASGPFCGNPDCNLCRPVNRVLSDAEKELALNRGPMYAGGRPL